MKKIAITGGIGSGKSVVCQIISTMGYECFDCDKEAKRIMDSSENIKQSLIQEIHPQAVVAGIINRKVIAETVFSDNEKLQALNKIVHSAVRDEISCRFEHSNSEKFFVETAILYESGIDKMVDEIWLVDANLETRIKRVMKRNNMKREDVIARIKSQNTCQTETHPNTYTIHNDDSDALLSQIIALLNR